MWRILNPTSQRRAESKVVYFNSRRHFVLFQPRLVAIYLLVIVLLYIYIRYLCYLNHVTFAQKGKNSGGFRAHSKLVNNLETTLAEEKSALIQETLETNLNKRKSSRHKMPTFESKSSTGMLRGSSGAKMDNSATRKSNLKTNYEILRTLRTQWGRYVQMDFDWRKRLHPCESDMAWVSNRDTNQQTSIATSTFTLNIQPARDFSSIYIHTRTAHGQTKTTGGDAWRVYVRGPSALVAKVIDHGNGSYEALFLVQEPGFYTIQIILDFSQCDGLRDPPSDWFIQGNAQGKYQQDYLLGPLNDLLLQSFKPFVIEVPVARSNFPAKDMYGSTCQQSCNSLWSPHGRWVRGFTWIPYFYDEPVYHWQTVDDNVTPSGTLWIYGDSVAKNLLLSAKMRALCNGIYAKCEFSYNWIYPVLNGEQTEIVVNNDLDFEENRVIYTIKEVLAQPDMMNNTNSTLLLNLGLHFVMTLNFTTYQRLIDHVIDMLRSPGKQFKANVVWKTTTAIYKENAKQRNLTHFRFLTSQRIQLFNAYSTWAMCRAGIHVVDVYPITASYPNGPFDVVHYPGFVTHALEQKLEEYRINAQRDDQITKFCLL